MFWVEVGKLLVVYMGDDCCGGYIWKFVSDGIVFNFIDLSNSRLFNSGIFYVVCLNFDGFG